LDRLSLHSVYGLGAALGPLADLKAGATRGDYVIAAFNVRPHLAQLFVTLPALAVCRAKAMELSEAIQKISDLFGQGQLGDWATPPEPVEFQFGVLTRQAGELQIVLVEELQGLPAYHPAQTGIYDTPSLIERGEQALTESARVKITAKATDEIREGGKCLAFGLFTASGFHVMRAVEAVLHQYYVHKCKPANKRKNLPNWGAYISALRKILPAGATDDEVTVLLQQVKDDHRNLIMHPEIVLSGDEAFGLFDIAKAVIGVMAERLPTPKPK